LTNLTHANAMALLTARCGAPGVRVVAVEHSTLSVFARTSGPLRHRLLPLVARATYRHADAIVAVSRGARSELARTIGLPESRIEQIPNALPVDQLRRRAADPSPHSWLEPGAPAVLLGIGSLRPVKGYSRLLHAFAALRGRRRARLVILGEGPERRRLERLAGTLGVRDDVRFPGTVENPYPWIARSGGLVLTSSAEGLPTVLLEALALGRPVVAVDCPSGPREILDGGRLGRLVPQDDQEALVEGMAWAVDRRRISIPDEMIAPYDPDHVAERYLRLLRPQSLPIGEPIPA
jgi:glycosyltransferase involved in cell wall biosynthesis